MYSKHAVVNRARRLMGSRNLDPRSKKLDSEASLVFEDPALSAQAPA